MLLERQIIVDLAKAVSSPGGTTVAAHRDEKVWLLTH